MITKTITPKNRTNDPYFRYEVAFDSDCKKTYTCKVIGSNLPAPKFVGFTTRQANGASQNYIILEFEARCNNTQMMIEFLTENEVVEEKKREYFTWVSKWFTWFDFIFRIFKLSTLKSITKSILVSVAVLFAASTILGAVDYGYEKLTGESLLDSSIAEVWEKMTLIKLSKRIKEDAPDAIEGYSDFVKDKLDDTKEKLGDAFEATKEKAGDLKDNITDKIEDIRD